MRVQIPAYTDRWMMGDRYGEVVMVTRYSPSTKTGGKAPAKDLAYVKLDVSGKTIRVFLDDCTVA